MWGFVGHFWDFIWKLKGSYYIILGRGVKYLDYVFKDIALGEEFPEWQGKDIKNTLLYKNNSGKNCKNQLFQNSRN